MNKFEWVHVVGESPCGGGVGGLLRGGVISVHVVGGGELANGIMAYQ